MARQLFYISDDKRQKNHHNLLYDKVVLFHGVNKSGSLCLSSVIKEAYYMHGRRDRFFSRYHSIPRDIDEFQDEIRKADKHCFFVDHNLYHNAPASKIRQAWITQLRHPLPRALSSYQWNKNKHVKSGSVGEFPPISEYFESIRNTNYWQYQFTQFGLGFSEDRYKLAKRNTMKDILSMALENLERDFTFVGIAELFEETIFILADMLGLDFVTPWTRDERNKGRISVSDISKETNLLIEDIFEFDYLLYKHAKNEFEKLVRSRGIGGEILRYKAACESQYKDRVGVSKPLAW